ncbi:CMT1A duplicated region transcript 4 protein isoform X3 [Mustela lutreola]|uniref:CMT1A duplicated region transcript 4 protein isoform X3 n=1 Tax=Mustela lutreola TaxID=9666 RepID=UPI0003440CEA|nr:CMT1A duplicated region transcript 4 protein isoform X3 [Mustela lutreola]XP_059004821.1 CMT1A duplicated region transcript 4 protein isoform X3 [Mustela lutreola]
MNCTRDLQELPGGRRKDKKRLEKGLTENIGLPLCVLEKHNPWPAYVTYMSPMVKRLIEKSKARDLEYAQALEESQPSSRQNKLASITQLKRKKSSKGPGNLMLKDMLSVWSSYSVPATGPTAMPEPRHFHTDSRENPTANYNKIIFSRKPMMRLLPYSSLLVSKEKHSSV